jgi:hypothetical protein
MAIYTAIHVAISLIAIVTGLVVLAGLLKGQGLPVWTMVFLATTVATSLTGFGFPFEQLLPSHIVGAISLVALAVAYLARYRFHLANTWRTTYVVTAVLSLYLNVFVLVVQLFMKVPALAALAPTQSEPPFAIAQTIVLVIFLVLGYRAVVGFRKTAAVTAARQYL